MLKSISATFFLLVFFTVAAVAQEPISIDVSLKNAKDVPVSFAAITVSAKGDTSKKLQAFSNENGKAMFDLPAGNYQLLATAVGYSKLQREIMVDSLHTHFVLPMDTGKSVLKEVVVRAQKPLMRQEDDKTIVDAESLAAASTNGYEVLEKTPGIFVDPDGNVYLSSTTSAAIYINGRPLKMSRSDVASMLRSLPPNAIEKIELLRTPSAKYDASSSGGIVNIVLRKGIKIGLNGSVNVGFLQGTYGNQFLGFSLNNSNGRTATYINGNFANNKTYNILNTDRYVAGDTVLSQQARTVSKELIPSFGYGINHDFSDAWNINYEGRVSYSANKQNTDNHNDFLSQGQLLGTSLATLSNRYGSLLISQDASTNFKIDSSGSEWVNALHYTYRNGNTDQDFNTVSAMPYGGYGTVKNPNHFISFQSDLSYKLRHRITLEAGIKTTYLHFVNDANYYLTTNGQDVADNARTASYVYKEHVNAAYGQASKGLGSFVLKAGLRMENTNMEGRQTRPSDTTFSIKRTDFFPYVYLSRKLMSIAHYELRSYLVYRRTITRPSYDQLNPFPKYVDQFLSDVGNPNLKPQFTNNYEANVSIADMPLLALGYNDTRDMFTNVYYQDANNAALAYRTYDNVGHNKEFYLRGFAAIPPGGKYFGLVGGQFNRNIYEGLYGGAPLTFSGNSWLFFTYHQLKLDDKSMLTLNGFIRLKGPLQFYELGRFGALNLSVNRQFLQRKLTVTLSVNDVLYSKNNTFKVEQATVNATGYRAEDSRRIGITARYNFGFAKKEDGKDMFDKMTNVPN
ncbi:MAG: TonB-dependent receptor [Edaphocola sp.]